MAQKMTDKEWRESVSYGTRTGKLSTVRADGSPHVASIWFLLDGDDVVFSTGKVAVKGALRPGTAGSPCAWTTTGRPSTTSCSRAAPG